MAMTVMRTPKKASSFLRPYLSRNKNVKVSAMVIKTPPYSGILKMNKNVKLFALVFRTYPNSGILKIILILTLHDNYEIAHNNRILTFKELY